MSPLFRSGTFGRLKDFLLWQLFPSFPMTRGIFSIVLACTSFLSNATGTTIEYVLEPFGTLHHLTAEATAGLSAHNASLTGNSSALVADLPTVLSYSVPVDQQPHNCIGAEHVGLWFQPQDIQGTLDLNLFLLVDGHCTDNAACQLSYHYTNGESVDQIERLEDGWMKKTWLLDVDHWKSDASNQTTMELDNIRGWRLVLNLDTPSEESSLLLDRLSCVGDGNLLGAVLLSQYPPSQTFSFNEVAPDGAVNETVASLEDGDMTVDFTVGKAEPWGGFVSFDFYAPGVSFFNLSKANVVGFDYTILVPDSSGHTHLRLQLGDDSDCTYDEMGRGCHDIASVEVYYSFHHVLQERAGSNGRIQVELIGDNDPSSPFWRSGWVGTVGNDKLDKERVKGFIWQFVHEGQGVLNDISSGRVMLGNVAAAEILPNTTNDDLGVCHSVDLAFVDNTTSLRRARFQSDCCIICAADPNCLYVVETVLRQKECYLATEAPSVRLARTETELSSQRVMRIDHAALQLEYCDVCSCNQLSHAIDCTGRNLASLPSSFNGTWQPKLLDLRNNPRLRMLNGNDLSHLSFGLAKLYLPSSIVYLSNETIQSLPNLTEVIFERNGLTKPTLPGNVVSDDGQSFSDVCCNLGETIAGLTFCEMQVAEIGSDTLYEPFARYADGDPIVELLPSSNFMSEAAESPQKCAEYCKNTPECTFFQYDARVTEAEHNCRLLKDIDLVETFIACCEDMHFADVNRSTPGYTSGRPPRTRHKYFEAYVLLETQQLALESSNGFSSTYSVRLGSAPLRGAVWVEPSVAPEWKSHVNIFPARVVLYDNQTTVAVTVSLIDPDKAPRGEAFVVSNTITACDTAFMFSDVRQMSVVASVVRDSKVSRILVSVLVPILLLVVVASFVTWYSLEKNRIKANSLWAVDEEELIFGVPPEIIGSGTFGQVVLAEYRGTEVAVKRAAPLPTPIGMKEPDLDSTHRMVQRSTVASVLQKSKRKPLPWNRGMMGFMGDDTASSFRDEIRMLSTLRHPNVTTIIGAVSTRGQEMIVLEYMQHGSLNDLLANSTLKLDEYSLPLLCDVSQGMRFLHAAVPQIIHGDLKSHNVLVDSNFRAKVADFGLSNNHNGYVGTPYWMAPELLRQETSNSCETDVYSFGIVLYEVYARATPYDGENCFEVLKQVVNPDVCKRPPVPRGCPVKVELLMNDCLESNSLMRPSFEEINMQLRRMAIEAASAASTKSDQTEALLNDVFPKHIAETLRQGKVVEPEHHECVTIFFSDVVGYTKISSALSPIKVSNLLGRLYGRFDELLDVHGVFKVETIGDAFMAVTNLSDDQPDHMKRMVSFAKSAIIAARSIAVDEEDPEKGNISIRVGIHSGPVVASVVGKRNPRYCLFGDTVNVSSRMESTSEVNRIQCSESSAKLLAEQAPSEIVIPRGMVEIKGKGSMETYWVGDVAQPVLPCSDSSQTKKS